MMMDKEAQNKETVILMHGIGHSLWNMIMVEKALKANGYKVMNLSYPSRKNDIKTLAGWLNRKITTTCLWETEEKIHFIGHSMGGLVIGTYLEQYKQACPAEKMGRVIMLGTPHGGSEVADFLHKNPLYQWVFGPAGQELTTHVRQDNKIQPWYDLGIIAGTQNWMYPLGLFCIKETNDGCVSVKSTKLEGMKDHLIISALHGLMGWQPKIHKQILHFLKHGIFNHEP